MITHDIVLEMPWLKKHNSDVDWIKRVLTFKWYNCVSYIQSTHQQSSMMNKKQSWNLTASCKLAVLNKNNWQKEFISADTNINQLNHEARVNEESHESSENLESMNITRKTPQKHVLHIYRKWKHLFQKEKTATAVSKHQTWNHKIKLKSGKEFTFKSIYMLSEKKLKTLHKYLNENMKKEFIKKFQLLTEYSILFILKKNETLCLCVNYQKLNDIIIKNWYSLFNISKLQNRLAEARYFIKFNL